MIFHATSPSEDFDIFRMESAGGRWELGGYRVIFGVRVRVGMVGKGWCAADLCCGADPMLRAKVLAYVLWKLEALDEETTTERAISDLFPYPDVKPLNFDPKWAEKLAEFDRVFAGL